MDRKLKRAIILQCHLFSENRQTLQTIMPILKLFNSPWTPWIDKWNRYSEISGLTSATFSVPPRSSINWSRVLAGKLLSSLSSIESNSLRIALHSLAASTGLFKEELLSLVLLLCRIPKLLWPLREEGVLSLPTKMELISGKPNEIYWTIKNIMGTWKTPCFNNEKVFEASKQFELAIEINSKIPSKTETEWSLIESFFFKEQAEAKPIKYIWYYNQWWPVK